MDFEEIKSRLANCCIQRSQYGNQWQDRPNNSEKPLFFETRIDLKQEIAAFRHLGVGKERKIKVKRITERTEVETELKEERKK
jgi:hypothetical protein